MRIVIFLIAIALPLTSTAITMYQSKVRLIEQSLVSPAEIKQWRSDILFPHLYEQWLSQNITTLSPADVDIFLKDPENNAAAWFFTPKWHAELIRREDWQSINQAFADESDPDLICYYLQSQQELNLPIDESKVASLWDSGLSRPDHCDPFLIDWISKQPDAESLVWKRQLRAFYSRNGKLLRYLNRFYETADSKSHGQFLAEVYGNPRHIVSQHYNPDSSKMHELALAAVNRMAYQDPRSASNLWLQIVKATPAITQQQIREASRYLGIAMAKQALPEASYWLSIADPKGEDEDVQHWRLQIALTKKDYNTVISYYQQLSDGLKRKDQWRYWYGYARLKTDGSLSDDNPLKALSKQRLYYGYLAAGTLGITPSLNAEPDYPPVAMQQLTNRNEIKRAQKLFESGDIIRAQVEWNLLVRNLDNELQHTAAELALTWGWYAKASQSAGWSGRYDLIHLRYPNAFDQIVNSQAEKLDLPNYWIYGVMRQESRYENTAVSPAGAYGLMQILPSTAKQTAKRFGIPFSGTEALFDPQTNIEIGSQYLHELLGRFDHPVFATAAYNAGPSRVNAWRELFPNDIKIWIESIPFDETRNYVKSVLVYSQIYALTNESDWHLASWTHPNDALATLIFDSSN